MKADQPTRLDDLSEQLMDAFLAAADPGKWSGAGKLPTELDPTTRGARNWDIKNANQIGALTARAMDLRDRLAGKTGGAGGGPDDAAEADISRFERAARDALKKAGLPVGGS